MKYGLMCLVAGLLALGTPAQADVVGEEEEEKEGVGGVNYRSCSRGAIGGDADYVCAVFR